MPIAKKDKKADQRMRRVYGISLDDYNRMLLEQNGGCKICGRKTKENRRLHIDHFHANKYILTEKIGKHQWKAACNASQAHINAGIFFGRTKQQAIYFIQQATLALNVRGLLCFPCNRSLQRFNDNPDLMQSAAKYINEYQEKLAAG